MIPPFSVIGKINTKFKEKTKVFNKYFSSQWMPLPNYSKLPENQSYITETKLSCFDLEDEDIYKIIKTYDINKAHGHDDVSIRMLKLCERSIVKPLSIIFKNCKLKKTFPILLKKATAFPIHKKRENDLKKFIVQFHFYQYLGKFLKHWYLTIFWNTMTKMNYLILINQAFVHLILV